jgi:hypothetical protein
MERVIWWIAFAVFTAIILLGFFVLATVVSANPETAAFVLGLLGFWLFANRLLFGFGQIANLASAIAEGEEVDSKEVAKKVAKRPEEAKLRGLEELNAVTLLSMWRGALEPFKYAYYLGFFLVFLLAVLFELNIVSSAVIGPIVIALTLGAAIPTVLVWGLEMLADRYLVKALEKAIEDLERLEQETKEEQSQKGEENK